MGKLIAILALFLAPAALLAEDQKTVGADLQLVSEVSSIQPGQPFTVALHIRHQEGFHTYWKSPGIVGVPTSIEWTLPEGFRAGPIQWPAPEVVDMASHPAHGFHREVLLLVEMTPPREIPAKSVTFDAKLVWMACARECHPGFGSRSLTLPVVENGKRHPHPKWAGRIARERKSLPQATPHWEARLESAKGASPIVLRIKPIAREAGDPGRIYFFSEDGQISSEPPQLAERQDDGSYLITADRSEWGPDEYASLPGVVRATGSWTRSGAVRVMKVEPRYPR